MGAADAAGDPVERWCGEAGASGVELSEFVFGAGKADLEAFDLAEPSFAVGFGDACGEVFSDFF